MRMLMKVSIPHQEFNTAVRDGSAGEKLQKILAETKPEAVYFVEFNGKRGAIMIVNVEDPSKIPSFAEPWFLSFNADVEFHITMSPEDLGKAGWKSLAKSGVKRLYDSYNCCISNVMP
jgi:hypothetical protein